MSYRWKNRVEAIQLPGDLVIMRGPDGHSISRPGSIVSSSDSIVTAAISPPIEGKKGEWLVFDEGRFVQCLTDKEFRERTEVIATPRKKKVAAGVEAEQKPKRGRPRGMKLPLSIDGMRDPADLTE